MQLSQKRKLFSQLFFEFSKFRFNFEYFLKKDDPHSWCIFELAESEKGQLDKCLKSPVSEHPSISNMVNELKHCWNLNGSTFTIFFDPCEGNSVGKILS